MSTNIIKMNRGDDYSFDLTIEDANSDTGYYILTGDDAVYFSLMEPNAPFECPLVGIKVLADGTVLPEGYASIDDNGIITIKLLSEATEKLLPGVYYYSVKLQQNHLDPDDANKNIKSISTIINKTKFIILD